MNIKGTPWKISITRRDNGRWYDFGKGWILVDPSNKEAVQAFEDLKNSLKGDLTDEESSNIARKYRKILESYEPNHVEKIVDTEALVQGLRNFFSEFHFKPNYRFLNTMANKAKSGNLEAISTYIANYFSLTDSPYVSSVKAKMQSDEFKLLVGDMFDINTEKKINHRLKIYYGDQGSGKTTQANNEADVMTVCHSAILPQDMMEDFAFDEGKASFHGSAFKDAMINGKVIVLDEINLLPLETLRFLQSILDGKEEFTYKGEMIKIHPNFKVIGTMNLIVNGCTYGLPEPLVDRAEDLVEFEPTNEMLASNAF